MTRKEWRRNEVINRVIVAAYAQITEAMRPPALANYSSIIFCGAQGARKILRRKSNTLMGWVYHDTGLEIGA